MAISRRWQRLCFLVLHVFSGAHQMCDLYECLSAASPGGVSQPAPPDRTGIFYYFSKVHISRRYVTPSRATRYCASDATSVKRVEKAGEAGEAAARIERWRLVV